MTAPTVSVIVPCHDVAAHVTNAIASLRAQTFPDFEAIVVDDGSTDATAACARAAIGADPRFRLIAQSNAGLSVARNTGLAQARGRYVAFLDGDDRLAPDFLARLHAEIARSGADWVACALWLDWPDRRVAHSGLHGAPVPEGTARWLDLDDARSAARVFPSAWNKLYRRALIGDLRFRPGALYEDQPFFWALATRRRHLRYLPVPLYHHRRGRAGQITALGDDAIFQQFDRLDEIAAILDHAALAHPREGVSQLATRLVAERLVTVQDADRRARFIAAAGRYFARHALRWDTGDDPAIDPAPAPEIDPAMRLGVIIRPGGDTRATRAALAAQRLPVAEIRTGPGVLPTQLDTHAVAVLRAGDAPAPDWSARMLAALADPGATLAVCAAHHAARGLAEPALAWPRAMVAAPDRAMLVTTRTALGAVPGACAAPRSALAALWIAQPPCARRVVDASLIALADRSPPALWPEARALRAAARAGQLGAAQAAAAFAHLAQLDMARGHTRPERLARALRAGVLRRLARLPRPPAGTSAGPILRACLGARQPSPR